MLDTAHYAGKGYGISSGSSPFSTSNVKHCFFPVLVSVDTLFPSPSLFLGLIVCQSELGKSGSCGPERSLTTQTKGPLLLVVNIFVKSWWH